MTINTVIFDLDGTLIDPSRAICNSINYALAKLGYNTVEDLSLYPYIGRHLAVPFRDITGSSNEDHLWELIHAYRERYETVGIKENNLYPGIKKMLQNLSTQNFIASVKPANACRMILKELGIEKLFSGVYGSEVDGTRADKSELLHHLRKIEGIKNAVMVGDRDTDIEAAKSCQFKSVGVVYGFGGSNELENAAPDVIVERPTDLESALAQLLEKN